MTSHLGIMILFALCVSAVFGTLFRDVPREQIHLGARIFGTLVAGGYAVGWLMHLAF